MKIGKTYRSCSDIPLSVFIRVLISGDVKLLVVWGWASLGYLGRVWASIFEEYAKESQSDEYKFIFSTMKDYTTLHNTIIIAENILHSLSFKVSPELVKCANSIGFSGKFSPKTMEKDFKRAVAKLKSWRFRLERIKGELKDKSKDNTAVSDRDFNDILAELSAFQGYRVDPDKTTVTEYISLIKRFKKSIEDGKRRKDNGINRR